MTKGQLRAKDNLTGRSACWHAEATGWKAASSDLRWLLWFNNWFLPTSRKDSEVIIRAFVILKEGTREAVGTIFIFYPEHLDTEERLIEFVPQV
jgi:hypothetical protein